MSHRTAYRLRRHMRPVLQLFHLSCDFSVGHRLTIGNLQQNLSLIHIFQKNVKGILLCLVLAIPCWFLGQAVPVVGGPVFGILAGMLITLLDVYKRQSKYRAMIENPYIL